MAWGRIKLTGSKSAVSHPFFWRLGEGHAFPRHSCVHPGDWVPAEGPHALFLSHDKVRVHWGIWVSDGEESPVANIQEKTC